MRTQFRGHRQERDGQSLVEFALVLPLMLLLIGGGYTMWTGLHAAIGVASAARAGALTASAQLTTNKSQPLAGSGRPYSLAQMNAVLANAAKAVTAEDGVTQYQAAPCNPGVPCVSISSSNLPTGGGVYLPVVTISVTQSIAPQVPMMSQFTVAATATCPAPGGS